MLEEAILEDMPVIEEQALRDQVHIFPTDANLRLQTHPDGDNEWLVPSLSSDLHSTNLHTFQVSRSGTETY